MDRLTTISKYGNPEYLWEENSVNGTYDIYDEELLFEQIKRLAAYEDTGLEPEEIKELCTDDVAEIAKLFQNMIEDGSIEHLQDLLKAEKEGKLVVLPCKVGDVVYEANKRGFISTYKVISIHLSDCSMLIGWELIDGIYSNLNGFEASALGKTVFLTREEAEAELKKMEGNNEAD